MAFIPTILCCTCLVPPILRVDVGGILGRSGEEIASRPVQSVIEGRKAREPTNVKSQSQVRLLSSRLSFLTWAKRSTRRVLRTDATRRELDAHSAGQLPSSAWSESDPPAAPKESLTFGELCSIRTNELGNPWIGGGVQQERYVSPAPVMKPHTADTIAIAAGWIQALMSTKLQSCTLSMRCIINKPLIIEKACRPVSLSESSLPICLHFSSRASAELPTS